MELLKGLIPVLPSLNNKVKIIYTLSLIKMKQV